MLVAINPNHPEGLSLNELGYSEYTDSFEDVKPYAESNGRDFPYLHDGEQQLMARAYGCLATPHVFVSFSWDDVRNPGAGSSHWGNHHAIPTSTKETT